MGRGTKTKRKSSWSKRRRRKEEIKTPIDQVDLHVAHSCYLVYSPKQKKAYVGYTTRPWRRLRQHRGEITGGAKKTLRMQDPNIRFLVIVTRFLNVRDATQFEWLWQHPTGKIRSVCRGPRKLCQVLHGLLDPVVRGSKPWTNSALPLNHCLREQVKCPAPGHAGADVAADALPAKDPHLFHVHWFDSLPRGFKPPESTNSVQHHLHTDLSVLRNQWKQWITPKSKIE